jgi:hypothetical protein
MKMTTLVAVALMGLGGVVRAEMVSVVQITDMHGQVGYEVMNREEFNKLLKEIKEETAVFAAAAADSKKEWEANKDNKLPFQGNRIKPRVAKKVVELPSRDKADKKKSQLEDRASNKQIEEIAKEEKKVKQSKPKEEDVAKEEAKVKAFDDAFAMISQKMGEKLGRPVPSFGFAMTEPKKEGEKKEGEKKKEEPKKEEPKKDGPKKDEKKLK